MKFKKTAIAAVVAGFAAAPMMASADTVLSGVVQVKFQGTDEDGDDGDVNIAAGDVRAAIATEHELNSGLIGYGNIRLNIDDLTGEGGLAEDVQQVDIVDDDGSLTDADPVELESSATVASDEIYVGVKGGFGDVRLGEIPLAVEFGQLANDIHDAGTQIPGGISYTGTFGGFGIGLNFSPEQDSDVIGVGAKYTIAGFSLGAGFEDRGDAGTVSVGASYAIAGFSLAAHYWARDLGFDDLIDVDDTGGGTSVTFADVDFDDATNLAFQVGYSIAGVSLGLTYSVIDISGQFTADGAAAPSEVDGDQAIIRFDAGYDLGGGLEISTRIQSKTDEIEGENIEFGDLPIDVDDEDLVEYRVMLSKTF